MKQNETHLKHKWNIMKHRNCSKYMKNKGKSKNPKKCVSFVSKIPLKLNKVLLNNNLLIC